MEYLVQVSGDVSERQCKTYVVRSNTEDDARHIAAQKFCDDFAVCSDAVSIRPNKRLAKAVMAYVFLSISIFLSLIGWKNGHDTISIAPDLLSCLYSLLFYAAFIVRFKGLQRTVGSWVDIVFCCLMVLLMASFVRIIMNTGTNNPFAVTGITLDANVILPIAIILSWLGLKFVSLCCMGGVVCIALINISTLNDAMGMLWGPAYIICAFIGIMLYLSVEPALPETVQSIRRSVVKGVGYVGNDVIQAKNEIQGAKSRMSKVMGKKDNGEMK